MPDGDILYVLSVMIFASYSNTIVFVYIILCRTILALKYRFNYSYLPDLPLTLY